MAGVKKPSGFKNYSDLLWINERSRYGCRYRCKTCGKTVLGTNHDQRSEFHHYSHCAVLTSKTEPTR